VVRAPGRRRPEPGRAGRAAGLVRGDETHRGLLDDAVTAWRAVEEQAAHPGMIALRREALEDLRRAQRERWARPEPPSRALDSPGRLPGRRRGAGFAWRANLPDVYRTTEGERRIVELADGSRASLDSATVLKVKYESGRRRLWLDSGRAKFSVAKDPLRPFSVAAGDKLVVATGTVFSVERLTGQMRVVLYEGHVAVLDDKTGRADTAAPVKIGGAPADRLLTPDHELVTSTKTNATVVSQLDPVRAKAWENGQLVFQDEPMELAVERVNRYARDKLKIGDPGVGQAADQRGVHLGRHRRLRRRRDGGAAGPRGCGGRRDRAENRPRTKKFGAGRCVFDELRRLTFQSAAINVGA
jgi:transmembrane sensor